MNAAPNPTSIARDPLDRRILMLAGLIVAPALAVAALALGQPLAPLCGGAALSLLSFLALAATADRLLALAPERRPGGRRIAAGHLARLVAVGALAVLFGRASLGALLTFLAGLAAVPLALAIFGSLGRLEPAAVAPGSVIAR